MTFDRFLRLWWLLRVNSTDLWPRVMTTLSEARDTCGRLPGLSLGSRLNRRAREINVIAQRLEQQHPETNKHTGAHVVSITDEIVGGIRPTLFMVFGAVIFVLLRRLRECRESAAGPLDRQVQGDHDSHGDRRSERSTNSPIAD